VLVMACGARTGVAEPETDAMTEAGFVGPAPSADAPPTDACAPETVTVVTERTEVLFVLDRSESMSEFFDQSPAPRVSRWHSLREALHTTMPRYDGVLDLGLLIFPLSDPDLCLVPSAPQLAPAPRGATALLARLDRETPLGRTPTAAALSAALQYFAASSVSGRQRAVVLATDGGPNCNAAIPSDACPCTAVAGLSPSHRSRIDPMLCLDDLRTEAAILALRARGIPTLVLGIHGAHEVRLEATLGRLARAGGRPNPLDPLRGYYAAQSPSEMQAAFEAIQRSVVSCVVGVPWAPTDARTVQVSVDSAVVPRDPLRAQGWDWTDPSRRAVELFGEACTRVQAALTRVAITRGCE
jgi:hypothetical protein